MASDERVREEYSHSGDSDDQKDMLGIKTGQEGCRRREQGYAKALRWDPVSCRGNTEGQGRRCWCEEGG